MADFPVVKIFRSNVEELGKCNTTASNYDERSFSDIVDTSMILSSRSIADCPRLKACYTLYLGSVAYDC